ncbi:hypothetical protein LZ554_001953 [Drepanopeziza brunnea f. sp. 'monogermtubi']|nr:hypothetical protein LZ554_001953 [Drepanopeziza brunnea f. sp. 'monogermtubi']
MNDMETMPPTVLLLQYSFVRTSFSKLALPEIHSQRLAHLSHALDPEELKALEDDNVLLSPPVNGKGKISASFLCTPPGTQASISSGSAASSGASASVRILSYDSGSRSSCDIPETTRRLAQQPYPNRSPNGILQFALGEISRLNIAPLCSADVVSALGTLGISKELKEVLLAEETCECTSHKIWCFGSLRPSAEFRHATLEAILLRLKSQVITTLGKKARQNKRANQASSPSAQPGQPYSLSATGELELGSQTWTRDLRPRGFLIGSHSLELLE